MAASVGLMVDAASGALILALGLFVLTRRPWRAANVAFAVFSLSWGGAYVLFNVRPLPVLSAASAGPWVLFASALALVYLLARFPRRLGDPRHIGAVLAAVGIVLAAATLSHEFGRGLGRPGLPVTRGGILLGYSSTAALLGGALLLALRFRGAAGPEGERERSQYTLMAAALLMDPGIRAGLALSGGDPGGVVLAALLVAIAAAWFAAVGRSAPPGPDTRRAARSVGLLAVALPVVGLLLSGPLGGYPAVFDSGVLGVARAVAVGLFAYAMVRHQLLGIDVKLRWGISKATVAAVFIAVFFVASEAAQEFFGERAGSQYVGILAAGALVFAIAPLSRLADRLAERAVPVATGAGPVDERAAAIYRAALRAALADGAMTAAEEEHLAEVQGHLELAPLAALRLRREVEAELEGGVA